MKIPDQAWSQRVSRILWLGLGLAAIAGLAPAADIFRGGGAAPSSSSSANSGSSSGQTDTPAAIQKIQANAQDRLKRTNDALAAVQAMQQAARAAAQTAAALTANIRGTKVTLPSVPNNSYGLVNGLMPAAAVPKDLANPAPGEDATLWTGASLPVPTTTAATNGTTTSTVTIKQTNSQAVLNWQSFNIGKSTTLTFDQSAGGADVGQWIAFNKIGVTGSPSQILGQINAAGQVYVINPNGIIFGGTAVVNTHALVASSLPIDDNLIQLGLLNNPDTQFLFSSLPQPVGSSKGTPAFTPVVTDATDASKFDASGNYQLNLKTIAGGNPVITVSQPGVSPVTLTTGSDFTVNSVSSGGPASTTTVTLTDAGLQKAKANGAAVNIAYTPAGDQYGNVEVQAGAQLTAPSTANVGGRIALIGPNVTNAGTISTNDGQTILAAGLQVGFDAHPNTDPTLRGLDVYVGKISPDSTSTGWLPAGTAINDQAGLMQTARGDVTIAGATVNQLGFIDSSTSVAYNGRIDLVADYNAIPNSLAVNSTRTDSPPQFVPASTGIVTLGASSVTRILPELDSTDRVVGTSLALPSLVDIRGLAIHLAAQTDATGANSGAVILAPAADKAVGSTGTTISVSNTGKTLNSGVSLDAGDWNITGLKNGQGTISTDYSFVNDRGQIYLDAGAAIDVSGSQAVPASVTENIVSVQLRGTELADSPLQRDSVLRGQTVQIDLRESGTFNGQSWVGTPLADTSGYVGLVQRSVGELTTSGGTVSLAAGDSIIMQKGVTPNTGAAINVSGGWIDYAAGVVQTTQVSSGGHVYDIAQATPDRVYDGIVTGTSTTTDPKWGTTQTTSDPLPPGAHFEQAYQQGGAGGKLSLTAPAMVLDGNLTGNTVAGPLQRTPAATVTAKFSNSVDFANAEKSIVAIPQPAALSLTFQGQDPTVPTVTISPTPPDIVFATVQNPVAVSSFGFTDITGDPTVLKISGSRGLRGATVNLSPDLMSQVPENGVVTGAGFELLAIDNSGGSAGIDGMGKPIAKPGGNITIPAGSNLTALSGVSAITMQAANIEIDGTISAPGGTINLTAYNMSPLTVAATSPLFAPPFDTTRGNVTLGANAALSTAGFLVDDRPSSSTAGALPLVTNGGNIAIAGSNVSLGAGSQLDVSGAVMVNPAGSLAYGAGGKIAISAGRDPNPKLAFLLGGKLDLDPNRVGLFGYAGPGAAGGSLTLQAPLIQLGGSTLQNGDTLDQTGKPANTLWLHQTDANGNLVFFDQGGFNSFNLVGLGTPVTDAAGNSVAYQFNPAIMIAGSTANTITGKLAPTVIAPQAINLVAMLDPSGTNDYVLGLNSSALPAGQRLPVSLSFSASTIRDSLNLLVRGDIVAGTGSVILTDPQTDPTKGVTFSASTVSLLGSVTVPGGTIKVSGATNTGRDQTDGLFSGNPTQALPTVDLGPTSVLSTKGTTVLSVDPRGLRVGTVLNGGTIQVDGNIVAETGATLDVSGWSDSKDSGGLLYLLNTYSDANASGILTSGNPFVQTVVDSDAGSILLNGGQELYTNATLIGAAGGPSAHGGTLSVSSSRYLRYINGANETLKPGDLVLEVTPGGTTIPTSFKQSGAKVIGSLVSAIVPDANGNPVPEDGHFGGGSLTTKTVKNVDGSTSVIQGGFDYVTLGTSSASNNYGLVQFTGSMSLAANRGLTIGNGGVIAVVPGGTDPYPVVTLTAPYVDLGKSFQLPTGTWSSTIAGMQPLYGAGTLTVNAYSLIDIGDLSLQQIGKAIFNTPTGDIRGNGTFDIVGAVTITARQVYPTTAGQFTIAAYDFVDSLNKPQTGSVTIQPSGQTQLPEVPLSAGGQLDIYASIVQQGGVLRAPVGTINLGWNGASSGAVVDGAHTDQNTGKPVPTTQTLTLLKGSVTSVSAADPILTQIPYGINLNGTQWIDPTGTDITNSGPPTKAVNFSGAKVDVQSGSTIDITGGGDLYAYQWIPGVGGSKDVLLATNNSFAVIPGYQSAFAPFGKYNDPSLAPNLNSDAGYWNATLKIGDQIYLNASTGLAAGTYTLLPARYALLPGAFLVTPRTGIPSASSLVRPDGSSVVAGYRFNSLNPLPAGAQPLFQAFEVDTGTPGNQNASSASTTVVRSRSQYADFSADTFFSQNAAGSTSVPRLPVDAGQLVFQATASLSLQGAVAAKAATSGRGGLVDIGSPLDILIGQSTTASNQLVLDPNQLNNFGAESLLIGGVRQSTINGTTVTVTVDNIVVDNATSPLYGSDIVLTANKQVTLKAGAVIGDNKLPAIQSDSLQIVDSAALSTVGATLNFASGGTPISLPSGTPGTDKLTATSSGTITAPNGTKTTFKATDPTATTPSNSFSVPANSVITLDQGGTLTFVSTSDKVVQPIPVVFGDGVAVRVSSDPNAQISRLGVSSSTAPDLVIGAGARIAAAGAILDSTYNTQLDAKADFSGIGAITFDSGRISLQLGSALPLPNSTTGLVLAGSALQSLQKSASALSLLSYSSIDLYGSDTVGSAAFANLSLHTPEIHGDGGTVIFAAKNILLDNRLNLTAPDSLALPAGAPPLGGSLSISGDTINLGANSLNVEQYAALNLTATNAVLAQSTGALATQGFLTVTTPVVAAKAVGSTGSAASTVSVSETVSATGTLSVVAPTGGPAASASGDFGASVSFQGASVALGTTIWLPGGSVQLHATGTAAGSDVTLGSGTALRVAGSTKMFNDVATYTDGGNVNLVSDNGNVTIVAGVASATGPVVDVSAPAGGGNAGTLAVSAVNGSFTVASSTFADSKGNSHPTLDASHGQGGTFSLDTSSLSDAAGKPTTSIGALESVLSQGGFTQSQSIRVRSGDVALDSTLTAHAVNVSADRGSIDVTGKIDASGATGGTIDLAASGSVRLESGSTLTVAGLDFDNAGKGGSVSLEAGSSSNGVAPATTDTRDSVTQRFLNSTTPVVSIESGSSIDLSVASVNGPSVSDQITAIANAAALGKYTGTLHLRAPQTNVSNSSAGTAPDVQINPIDGTIISPSSIVVEGYKTYTPIGGYIDSVEADIDADGRVLASGANTAKIVGSLTKNWAQTNSLLDATPGGKLLHLRPGAEIVSSTTPTTATLYAPSTTANQLSVPQGTTLTLPSTTVPGAAPSINTLVFSVATTLNPVDAGTYTYPYALTVTTSAPTPSLPVLADTSISMAGSVAANALTSSVAGVISGSDGTVTTFAAGATLPALAKGATLTFAGPGTLTSTANASLTITSRFAAGQSIDLPANSSVALSSNGGTVRFNAAGGTFTWAIAPLSFNNSLAVQMAAGATFTVPNTTDPTKGVAINTLAFSSAVTLNPVDAGSYTTSYSLTTSSNPLALVAGTSISLPAATKATDLASSVSGTITSSNGTITAFAAGQLPALPAGSVLTFDGVGILTATSTAGTAVSATNGFAAGVNTTLPANSTVLLSSNGGVVSFASPGTVTWARSPYYATNTIAVPILANTTITLPNTTDATKGVTSNTYTFTSAVTVKPVDAGTYTTTYTLTDSNPLSVAATTSVSITSPVADAGLTSSVGGTIVSPSGTKSSFAAGSLPALNPGSTITFSGSGTLSSKVSLSVAATNNLVAGAVTTLPANSTVVLGANGGLVTFAADGTLSWASVPPTTTSSTTAAAGATVTLPSTPTPTSVTVSNAATLSPKDNGSYTTPYTLSATSQPLPIVKDYTPTGYTTVLVTADVAPTVLVSSVAGKITLPDGTSGGTFAANSRLPALPQGSTLTFTGAGTLTAALNVSLQATNKFTAGAATSLPANSTVALGTNGGSVTFVTDGTYTQTAVSTSTISTVAVPVPANVKFTLPNTSGSNGGALATTVAFSSAATLNPVDAGTYSANTPLVVATPLPVVAPTSAVGITGVTLTSAVPAGTLTLTPTVGYSIQLPTDTQPTHYAAGTALPALVAGTKLTFDGAGTLSTTTNLSLSATNAFDAKTAVSLPANSTVTLTSKGGDVTFASDGTLTWSGSAAAFSAFNVAVPNGTPVTLPITAATGSANGAFSLTGGGILNPAVGATGTATIPYALTSSAPLTVSATSTVAIANAVTANALTSSVGGTITFSDGTTTSFAANSRLPALSSGSKLTFTGDGTLSIDQSLRATNGLPAGTATVLQPNSTAVLKSTGGAITFATPGSLTIAGLATSASPAFSMALSAGQTLTLPNTTGPSQGAATDKVTVDGPAVLVPVDAGSYTTPSSSTPVSFKAGATVNLPANSTVALSTAGGTITLTKDGTLQWVNASPTATNGITVPFASGTQLVLPSTTLANTAPSINTLTLTGASTLTPVDAGSFTATYSLTSSGTPVTVAPTTTVSITHAVPAATLTSSAAGTISFSDGTPSVAFKASANLPALPTGATLAFSGTGTLSATQATSFDATNKFAAGAATALPANSTVALSTNGGTIAFAQSGNLVWAAAALVPTNNAAGLRLASDTSFTTGAQATRVVTTGANTSLTLTRSSGALTVAAGGSLFLPQGTAATANTLQIGSSDATSTTSFTTTVKPTQGGTLTAGTSAITVTTQRGGTFSGTVGGKSTTITIAPNTPVSVAPGDSIQLANATDVVTVQSTGAFLFAGTGPTTLAVDHANTVSGLVSFAGGSGSITAVATAGTYTSNGEVAVVAKSTTGDLVLANNWDLSTFRYGPNVNPSQPGSGEPGILTIRASGNLVFNYDTTTKQGASLSDGFDVPGVDLSTLTTTPKASDPFWRASLLPAGAQSWSYRLVAGADLGAADFRQVLPLSGSQSLAVGSGSVLLGPGATAIAPITNANSTTTRDAIIPQYFQTIRTGTGDIDIYAGRDVQLLNPLATIYTAGTQASPIAEFDVPITSGGNGSAPPTESPFYPAQYSLSGGNVTIWAQNDIGHFLQTASGLVADSSREMPTNWLYRRGSLNGAGQFDTLSITVGPNTYSNVASTSWWIDFSNFFEGVGALGGGNVNLTAGHNVSNVDAVVPTNMRMTGRDAAGNALAPAAATAYELGGGDLNVSAGRNIDAGVYYVENGQGTLTAGDQILTNATRAVITESALASLTSQLKSPDPTTWLPTTLFLGNGSFDISATGDVLLGPVVNPFLLPQGTDNRYYYKSYFSTYDVADSIAVSSIAGNITLADSPLESGHSASLTSWYSTVFGKPGVATYSNSQPWLKLDETNVSAFLPLFDVMPPSLRMTAYSGDIDLVGNVTLAPSPRGTVDLLAGNAINGLQPYAVDPTNNLRQWSSSVINLSDADPVSLAGVTSPVGLSTLSDGIQGTTRTDKIGAITSMFNESGATGGLNTVLQTQQLLHGASPDSSGALAPLHAGDPDPVHLYALSSNQGDISGLTLYTGKSAQVVAGRDITDVALYIQNVSATDVSVVSAGRNITAYDANSALRLQAQDRSQGNELVSRAVLAQGSGTPVFGDIQISGPGTLEVLAGENLDLGRPNAASINNLPAGIATGITSVGNVRNPLLPFAGADIVAAAGLAAPAGLANSDLDYAAFVQQFLDPVTAGTYATRYLPEIGQWLGLAAGTAPQDISKDFGNELTKNPDASDQELLNLFYHILRDAGRDRNDPNSSGFGNYDAGYAAISALFGKKTRQGDISLASREIATNNGGNVSLLAPGGQVTVGLPTDIQGPDKGILTVHGGNVSIFARDSVRVGNSRIFTLHGGNEIVWSTLGDIAAGSGSKTVHSAPPTRVLIYPQSADVVNDLAGLATGSGIGVLATLVGVKPADVDLIAPTGTIDAGDAGIRSSGNLNIAARFVLNTGNIQVSGNTVGTPPPPAAPNLGSLSAGSAASAVTSTAATELAKQATPPPVQAIVVPSIITVEVLGFGGGEDDDTDKGTDKDNANTSGA